MHNTLGPADAELHTLCKLCGEQLAIIAAFRAGVIKDLVMFDAALAAKRQFAARIQNIRPLTRAGEDARAAVLSE